MAYLSVAIIQMQSEANSAERKAADQQIQSEGIAFLHQQPGFIRYQIANSDRASNEIVAAWEWASKEQEKAGIERWFAWMQRNGIAAQAGAVQQHAGNIVVTS